MGKILPVLIAIFGLAAGAGGGLFLKPAPVAETGETAHGAEAEAGPKHAKPQAPKGDHAGDTHEYVKINNQFVVPVIQDTRVAAMVVLSLSLEVLPGSTEAVYAREPRLRDSFLNVLFNHANAGGFDANFTSSENLTTLRRALLESARKNLGPAVTDVLVTDILRQDS